MTPKEKAKQEYCRDCEIRESGCDMVCLVSIDNTIDIALKEQAKGFDRCFWKKGTEKAKKQQVRLWQRE